MGLPCCPCQSFTGPEPLTLDDLVARPDRYLDACEVGRRIAVIDLLLPNALALQRLSIPAIIAKDSVCLRDDMPALEIMEDPALNLPLLHNLWTNRST
jgi:hypothetical protein